MRNLIMAFFALVFLLLNPQSSAQVKTQVAQAESVDLITFDHIEKKTIDKTKITVALIKQALENYHYNSMKIDDKVSKLAFQEFLLKLDPSKQFLLKDDIKKLEKYESKFDDQMNSGNIQVIVDAQKIMSKRILEAQELHKSLFKKRFDFSVKGSFESDPEKRAWLKNEKAFNDRWIETFKYSVISRYMTLVDEQDDSAKPSDTKKKKKSDAKPVQKLTDAQLWDKAYDAIDKRYKKYFERMIEEGYDEYLEKFVNAVSAVYDPHTYFLPPKKKEDFDIDISGSLEGIGAVLSEDGSYIVVKEIVPGGAAWKQKQLEIDDIILMVAQGDDDPISLEDMSVDEAVRYIRGKKGTEVRLTVRKPNNTTKVIPIVRDVVRISESYAKSSLIEDQLTKRKIGYIYLPKFYRNFSDASARNCSDDVRREVEKLSKFGIDGLILDLRNNGGGALEDARQMSGLFIPKGPIVQVRDHSGQVEVYQDRDSSVTYAGPMIVMVNRFSASASEILAGALQDYRRAIIVGGDFSHGKGTVQAVIGLNNSTIFTEDLGALKITIQKFFRITGETTQFNGVNADIVIPDPMEYTKSREQDMKNALKASTIEAAQFSKMSFPKGVHLKDLASRSKQRVKANNRMQKIVESIRYLTARRNDTILPLSIAELKMKEKEGKDAVEKYKIDDKNERLVISKYEDFMQDDQNISKEDQKQWKEDLKEKRQEWVENLQKDPGLEESIYILDDMINQAAGKQLRSISDYK